MQNRSYASKYRSLLLAFGLLMVMVVGLISFAAVQPSSNAMAGAEVVGVSTDSNLRALVSSNGSDRVRRIVYFKAGSHATGGANTPVASNKVCDLAGNLHFAQVSFTGTLAGSAPTLVIKWQNSKDDGTTWTDVGTWTTINATTTPASQSNSVGDTAGQAYFNGTTTVGATAVIYGDCWRATYTMGAGGSGSFSITGLEK